MDKHISVHIHTFNFAMYFFDNIVDWINMYIPYNYLYLYTVNACLSSCSNSIKTHQYCLNWFAVKLMKCYWIVCRAKCTWGTKLSSPSRNCLCRHYINIHIYMYTIYSFSPLLLYHSLRMDVSIYNRDA